MQELLIAYDPGVLAQRVADERGRVVINGLSTGLTVAALIGVLLYVRFGRDGQFGDVFGLLTWMLAFSAVVGVAILVARFIWLTRLKRGLRAVGEGVALVVSPWGIQCRDAQVPWSDITDVVAVKGALGHGYGLHVEQVDGTVLAFPLEGLDIRPGTLDSAVRAYSSGRHGVDLSVVDD